MNVLVDTSVWVDHFRNHNADLTALLLRDEVMTHPMIITELSCGHVPAPRAETLNAMRLLRTSHQASLNEISDFIEREKLFGLGCGLVDFALLASALLTPDAQLWTLDKRLNALAERFGIGYVPVPQ